MIDLRLSAQSIFRAARRRKLLSAWPPLAICLALLFAAGRVAEAQVTCNFIGWPTSGNGSDAPPQWDIANNWQNGSTQGSACQVTGGIPLNNTSVIVYIQNKSGGNAPILANSGTADAGAVSPSVGVLNITNSGLFFTNNYDGKIQALS